MSSSPARPPAVYADLLALPEGERAELLAGQIVTAPAPLPRHSRAQGALGHFIGGPLDYGMGSIRPGGPGGWWIFVEVDVQLGEHDVVRPDLCGYQRERLESPGDLRPFTLAPDWTCEVLSPSSAVRDRVQKRDLYARSGVCHYWIVDVEARVLEAFHLVDRQWVLTGSYDENSVVRIAPFEEVELPVGRLFMP